MRFDKKEANTKTRRSSAKSSQRKASRAGSGGITNASHCVTSVTESDYCDMASSAREQFTQAGEDMASIISFGSLPSSCSEASSEAEDRIEVADDGHGRSPASDLSPCDPCPELLRLPRPSLVIQQSTDSTDTATTTENTQLPRRVSCHVAVTMQRLKSQLGSKQIPSLAAG